MTNQIISRQTLLELDNNDLNSMTKAQLVEHLSRAIEIINASKTRQTGDNRKTQLVQLLINKPYGTHELAQLLDTSTKNISSIFFGLKKDGLLLYTNENGEKFLAIPADGPEYLADPETFKARRAIAEAQDAE